MPSCDFWRNRHAMCWHVNLTPAEDRNYFLIWNGLIKRLHFIFLLLKDWVVRMTNRAWHTPLQGRHAASCRTSYEKVDMIDEHYNIVQTVNLQYCNFS